MDRPAPARAVPHGQKMRKRRRSDKHPWLEDRRLTQLLSRWAKTEGSKLPTTHYSISGLPRACRGQFCVPDNELRDFLRTIEAHGTIGGDWHPWTLCERPRPGARLPLYLDFDFVGTAPDGFRVDPSDQLAVVAEAVRFLVQQGFIQKADRFVVFGASTWARKACTSKAAFKRGMHVRPFRVEGRDLSWFTADMLARITEAVARHLAVSFPAWGDEAWWRKTVDPQPVKHGLRLPHMWKPTARQRIRPARASVYTPIHVIHGDGAVTDPPPCAKHADLWALCTIHGGEIDKNRETNHTLAAAGAGVKRWCSVLASQVPWLRGCTATTCTRASATTLFVNLRGRSGQGSPCLNKAVATGVHDARHGRSSNWLLVKSDLHGGGPGFQVRCHSHKFGCKHWRSRTFRISRAAAARIFAAG